MEKVIKLLDELKQELQKMNTASEQSTNQIDLEALAVSVSEQISYQRIAENLDEDTIANRINYQGIAERLCEETIADYVSNVIEIDHDDLADRIDLDDLSSRLDYREIDVDHLDLAQRIDFQKVAQNIEARDVAESINIKDVRIAMFQLKYFLANLNDNHIVNKPKIAEKNLAPKELIPKIL